MDQLHDRYVDLIKPASMSVRPYVSSSISSIQMKFGV